MLSLVSHDVCSLFAHLSHPTTRVYVSTEPKWFLKTLWAQFSIYNDSLSWSLQTQNLYTAALKTVYLNTQLGFEELVIQNPSNYDVIRVVPNGTVLARATSDR